MKVGGGFLLALALFAAVLTAAPPQAQAQFVNFCSRTTEVVDGIRNKLSLVSSECYTIMSRVTGTFVLRNLTSLKNGDFDGMSGVTNLFLSNSSGLTSLPASPFDEMTSLNSLILSGTGLTSLPTGMFDNLDGLTRLMLPSLFTLQVKAEQHRGGVRARIDEAAPLPVSVTWTASGGGGSGTATIAAGQRTSAVFGAALAQGVTVTLSNPSFTGVSESTSDAADNYRNFQLGVDQSAASATTPPPAAILALSSSSISEGGGVATVTAVLSQAVSEAVTVTLTAAPGSGTAAADFTLSGTTLTIATGATSSNAVTITAVNNDVRAADKTVTVSGTASGGGVSDPSAVTLTITDNDVTVTSRTWRSGRQQGSVWDVTTESLLGKRQSQPFALTRNSQVGSVGVWACARRFDNGRVGPPTSATGGTRPPNDFWPCRQIAATVSNLANLRSITLTQAEIDNDGVAIVFWQDFTGFQRGYYLYVEWVPIVALPKATMTLTTASIAESGSSNVSTVTATLDKAALSAATITVAAAPAGDVTLSVAGTPPLSALRFAAGATASTTTVRITAVNDDVDAPDKSVTVSGTVAGDVKAPPPLTLTIADDEVTPTVTLALSPSAITEDGGVSSVTATLSGKSSEAVTVTVGAAAGTGAVAADFALSEANTLTIAAGSTTSTGDVTVRGNDNDVDSPNKSVTVSATVTGGNGVVAPSDVALTLEDDEDLPTVTLVLTPASIAEDGGVSSVTAALSGKSSEAVTVTVGAAAGAGAVGADFTLSGDKTLTIAAGSTASTGDVTVTANGNDVDSPDKSVTVSGTVTGGNVVLPPSDVTLTLTDNEDLPVVALVLSPASVSENGGVSSVTATLSGKSSEAVTVTVGAAEVTSTGAVATDFDLSTANTLTIAAGSTTSTGDVTVTANDNMVSAAHKQVTVSGTAAGGHDVLHPSNVTLTITDDEDAVVTLVLTPPSISESGGESSVTATLNRTAGAAVTVTVGAAAGTNAVAGDFELSTANTLTIAAGDTTSDGDVTVTANGNDVDSPDKSVTVSGAVASGESVTAPANVTLTLEDDEDLPTVTLALAPSSISEDGGVSSVTATLSGASSEAVTLTVGAAAVTSTGAVAADFDLSAANTLTIAAGMTASAGDVTVTANDNDLDVADKSVTVSATVTGGNGVAAPSNQTLTLTDDDTAGVTFTPATLTVTEQAAGKKVAVVLDSEPPGTAMDPGRAWISFYADAGLTVNGRPNPGGFTTAFTSQNWQTAMTVTVAALGDADHEDETLYVRYAVSGYGPGNVADTPGTRAIGITVNVTDDDKPVVTLALSPASIGENGGVSSVTATLNRTASAATTVTVGAAAGTGAVDADFTLSGANTLTIAAGATASTGPVTVTANDNDTDAPDKQVTVSATVTGGDGAADPADATLTLTDDDAAPGVTLSVVSSSIAENGGATSVSAVLSRPSSAETTVTVTAVSGFYTVGSDATVVIAAGDTTAAADMAGIAAVDDDVHQGAAGRSTTVTATVANAQADAESETMAVTGPTLTLTDDEGLPTAALVLTPASISETGGESSVTATLSGKSSAAVTVTVGAAAGTNAVAGDFTLSGANTLTIAAGDTTSTGDVTVTANGNDVDSPDKSVTVSGTVTGGNGVAPPSNATLTLTDDEALPTVTLVLTPTSVSESGGETSVTAMLSGKSSAAVTVTVGAAAGTNAVAGDFTLSGANTLTIAAGSTTSSGDVTVTANGNDVDSPDKSVTVSGTATGGNGVAAPSNATLTLEDDEDLPTVTLVLTPASISETGGESSVTARLSGKSSQAVTVTVGAAAGTGAVAADFDLSTANTLTIAAGATASTGDVTVTANGNDVDSPDKSVTVSATVTGGNGVVAPSNATLTLEDDEALPTVTLALSASSISENGGETTVTAKLSGKSSEAVTVTVGAAEVTSTGAVAADFTLSGANTLTIAAGDTASSGDVTVTANDNTVSSAQKQVTVSGTAAGGNSVANPSSLTLTITDDDAPLVTLALSATSISENGGVSSVTASLSAVASEATTVTVGAAAGTGAVAADFDLSTANTLTIAAGATASSGDVTVTAVNNETDAPNKQVTVSATVMGGDMAVNPDAVTLTLTDDDAAPGVTLSVTSSSIAENGGATSVSAVLDRPSSAVTTVTVTAVPGFYTVGSDATVVIAAGDTTAATDMAGIAAVDDDVHQGAAGRSRTVTATAVNAQATAESETVAVTGVTLTLTDDEGLPTAALVLTPTSISETNGETSVTATLSGKSSEAVTVTVGAAAGTNAVGADFDLSTANTLTIAAGATTSTGDVTVTANGNDVDSPNKSVTVSGSVTGGNSVLPPSSVTLTLTDDEDLPTVTLVLTPASVSESGGVSSVTARLSGKSSEAVTVTVGAAAGAGAVGTDFTLSGANTLTIAAGSTASTGDVTVTANGNDRDSPDKSVTVSGTVMGGNGVLAPSNRTLTLTDDDATPTVALVLTPASVTESGGVSSVTATLSSKSGAAVTVTVGAAVGTGAVAADFDLSTANTLTIAAGQTTSTGDVTVTANGNDVDSPDKSVTVSGTVTGGHGLLSAPSTRTLTLADDETLPTVTLVLTPASVSETNGESSVTATLSGASSEAVTVTVGAAAGTGAVGTDFTLSGANTLTIAAGSTASTGDVTVTANGNDRDSPDKSVTVSGTVMGGNGVLAPSNRTLTLTDDDATPTVALVLTPASVTESGGVSSVTATLSSESGAAVTVTVGAAVGTGAVGADFTLSGANTLTIAAGQTTSTGDVTVTANGNDVDSPDKSVTVSGTVTGGHGLLSAPSNRMLTLTDDETLPTVTLVLTPASVSETNGESSVTATLSGKSSEAVTVTVGAAAGTGAVGADFTLSGANTLTIAAGDTTSSGDVTVTANGNDRDSPDKSVTVSGSVMGGNNVLAPSNVTLTLTDDDATPTVTLVLTPASVSESGGVSSVTATLSSKSGAAVTVTVGAAAGTGAVAADFDLSTANTLTIAAGNTTSTGDVTVTANGNDVDSPDKSVTVSGTVTGGHGLLSAPSNQTLTLTDDDPTPGVTLSVVSSSISENGGATSVSAVLDRPSSAVTTVTVTAVSGFYTVGSDATVVIAAGDTTAASDMAGIAAVDDDVHQGAAGRSTTVTATAANAQATAESETVTVTGATLALTDDEGLPTVALVLTPTSISETNGETSVTATLSGKSSEAVTVTVGAAAGTNAVGTDFTLSGANTLTIAAGATTSTGDVTVTANGNDVDSPNKSVTVSGSVTGGNSVLPPSSVTLTLTDDEVLPTVTLVLTPASVTESGGESSVTARLSGKSSEAVTVTVGAAAGTGAVGTDFTLSGANTLTIAAGSTASTGDVTVTANGNDRDSPDKSVTVSGTVTGGNNVAAPSNRTLTLTDDDATPTVALVLTPASVTESGGVSSVTATLSSESGAAVTVTVGAAAGTGAVGADFTLSGANTLTIAAGQTTSTGDVTVTANGNDVDSPDKSVTVSGTVTGGHGLLSAPSNRTLTLTDDETLPTVTLVLTPASVSETNGESSVTARLSGKSSEAVTVTVGAAAGTGAVGTDFTLSGANTLTIAAGSTASTGDVTVTANGNDRDSPNKSVTVSGSVTGGNGVSAPSSLTLTLTDDDATPTVALVLTPASVSESGGVSSVTATLSSKSGAAVTVTVGAAAGTGAVGTDFTLSGANTLTIAAGDTTSSGDVTVTANGNDRDSPDKSVTVSGTVTGGHGLLSAPSNRTLTLTDDDATPTVTLVLTPASVSETNGESSVTATLSGKSSEAVTVTVGAAAGTNAVTADFTLSGANTLTIAAGNTTSTGDVTVTANLNTVDSPDKSVTVSGSVTGGHGLLSAPSNVTLTLEDDDVTPTATLALSAATIDESGTSNVSTVTATLNHGSSEALTITVSVSPVTSTGAVAGDYTLSQADTLTIAAGATTSSGTVTVTAVDNAGDEPDIEVTVSGSADGGRGVTNPTARTLTIRDDEGPPTVTLALSPASIAESGASNSAAVTAALNRTSSAATTVTVSAAPGTNAVQGDYTLSSAFTLTIAAGATTSTGAVTVTATDNDTDAPNKQVTVSGTAANPQGVTQPLDVMLTITDDEAAPTATLSVASPSIPEGGSTTVRAALSHRSSAVTTVTVTAAAGAYSVASGAGATIVIAAGQTANAADTATITAVNNAVDAADNAVTVTGTMANTQGVGAVTGASLTITDDDTAGLAVLPSTSTSSRLRTTEPSGTNTFTVALATQPTGNVVLGVASSDQTEGRPSPSSLTFTTADWNTVQTVTVTGQDDTAADGNVNYTISLTVNQGSTADGVYDLLSAVTVHAVNADDEYGLSVGTVTGQATEAGGQATFTVRLLTQPSAAVTVAVSSRDASEGRVSPSSLTFGTGNWNVDRTVTVTGENDDVDDGDVTWQVRLDPASGGSGGDSNYHALANVDVNVTTTDDDAAPTVRLALSPSSISENGGTAAVRATLNRASSQATTVTVTAVSGFYTVGSGAAETIVIPAGQTANASDTATITAVNDDVHQGAVGRSTTVTATAANGMGVGAVTGAALRLDDDEAAPGVTLSLSDASIPENGWTSVVSAVLSGESAAATTVTVTAVAGAYTVGSDSTIVIAAGDTTAASDTVTITAVDNTTDEPNRTATVTATLANSRGAGNVTGVTLTLEDNDAAPTATLLLASSSIPENGGSTTVRARLSNPSSQPTTVTVTALANVYTVASGAGATIIVAAGATTSSDTATIAAVDNDVDAADNAVTVTGTAANGHGVTAAATGASLTITDDDEAGFVVSPSTATSASSPLRTSEDGSQARFTVALATEPTGDVVLAVASSDTDEGRVLPSSLTFTAATWNTAQTVTLTGQDDSPTPANPNPAAGRRPYTVTLTVQGSTADGVYAPLSAVTVHALNADDEYGLELGSVTGQATEGGGSATFTVALVTQPSAAVTVSVSSRDTGEGRVSPSSLTFTTSNWDTPQRVTATGVDDAIDDGDVIWQLRLDPSSGDDNYDGLDDEDVSVTTRDDDDAPTVTLALTPSTIDESGTANVATVTATLSHPSSARTTITVAATAVAPALADDFMLSTAATLTIAAEATASTGQVTVTAVDNHVDAPDKRVRVTAAEVENDRAAADSTTMAVTGAVLTIADDDEKGLAFAPAEFLAVTAGGSTAYTVALTSEPTGEVTVTPATQDRGATLAPPSLTFTAADWMTAQTVTVTAGPDDDESRADAAAPLAHSATGGGYAGVTGEISLAVEGGATVAVEPGTNDYGIEGRRVTVTVEDGAPAGIEIDLTGLGAGEPLTVTISPDVAADTIAKTARDGYGLGPEAMRTVVDIAVSDAPSSGVRICLPVEDETREAAGTRPLLLLHYDGSIWTQVAGAEVSSDEAMICAPEVVSFSPFAVGYEDTRPAFADFTQTTLVFTVDEPIDPVTLPGLRTGDPPFRYDLLPVPLDLPPGLSFDRASRVLSGTPTERFEQRTYTWTATDVDGPSQQAELNITITVEDNLEKFRVRLAAINESILPELSRAMWGSALEAVTGRLASPGAGEALGSSLARALQAQEKTQHEGVSLRDLAAGRTFSVGLRAHGGDDGEGGGMSGGPGFGGAVLWGGGSRRSLSLDESALDWSGELFSAHMGVDAPLGERLRGGLAASWFASEIDYTDRSEDAAIEGVHESRMTALHPYLGWSGSGGAQIWGALGYGAGEIEIADAEVKERFGVQKSDSEFLAAAAGGSVPVLSAGRMTLALKGSGEATQYSVEDNGVAIAAVSVATQRLRLSAEGRWAYGLAGGGSLTPSLELGGRWDAGDGETGAGLELGGGLDWNDPDSGLSLALSGRTLAAHGGKLEEWGAGGSIRLAPSAGGRGASLRLEPRWGASESGLGRLWNEGMTDRAPGAGGDDDAASARLETELGYGFGLPGPGLLTPYGGFGFEQGGARSYRLGCRLGLGDAFDLNLEADRREAAAGPEHGIRLGLRMTW